MFYRMSHVGPDRVKIEVSCPFCGSKSSIKATEQQAHDYFEGKKLIQVIFPEKKPSQRELLVNGVCIKCQIK